jgi:hypothetical protein
MKSAPAFPARLTVIFISLLGFACSGHADVKPPEVVSAAFASQFNNAGRVHWEGAGRDFSASFSADGHDVTAFFGSDGTWLKTETEMISSELPAVVVKTIVGAFPGNSVTKTARVDSAGNVTYYRLDIRRKGKTAVVRLNPGGVILTTP